MRCENRMRTAEGWREHVSTNQERWGTMEGHGRAVKERCRGGGVIRWVSRNSTILHLDSRSRRHEMSVDSYPFMRLVPFL